MTCEPFQSLFAPECRWSAWAAPKTANGKPNLDRILIGADLVDFVNNDLMAYLRSFAQTGPTEIPYNPRSDKSLPKYATSLATGLSLQVDPLVTIEADFHY